MREYVRARLDANKAAWARVGAAARCIASPSWRCAAVSAGLLPTDAAPSRPPAAFEIAGFGRRAVPYPRALLTPWRQMGHQIRFAFSRGPPSSHGLGFALRRGRLGCVPGLRSRAMALRIGRSVASRRVR